jgi:1-acyl-sn-glycerol-3-phosphate acyltransferase
MGTSGSSFDSFTPPSPQYLRRALALRRWYFDPRISGLEHIHPDRPALLVGNHGLFGLLDAPLFVYELYAHTGVFPRSLGDHAHFRIPGWGRLLRAGGAVPGTPANCSRLMEAGEFILVFPGGAREVAKRRTETNDLVWKRRTGFARMALTHGYDILPFASVGCDDSYDIVFDGNDLASSRPGRWLLRQDRFRSLTRNGDLVMPLARGIGPTALPRPEPFRFRLGPPIATRDWPGDAANEEACWALREETAGRIRTLIEELQAESMTEERPRWRRWLTKQ